MAIALVQQATNTDAASASSFTVTLPGAPTAGNALVLLLGSANATPIISSVTSTGATWVKAEGSNVRREAEIWYAVNVSAGAGSVITVNLSANGTTGTSCIAAEFSGVEPSSNAAALDAHAGNSGNSTAVATASITPTASKEVLLLAVMRPGGAVSAGPTNSFTGLNNPDTRTRGAYRIEPSTSGSYSTGWTAGNGTWEAEIAALLGAAGSTPTVPSPATLSWVVPTPSVITGVSPAVRTWVAVAAAVALGGVTALPSPAVRTRANPAPVFAAQGQFFSRSITYTPIGQAPVTHGFQVYIPPGYTGATPQPCIVALGGSGQRGTDNTSQLTDGLPKRIIDEGYVWPTITVCPQWPALGSYGGREWAYPAMLAALAAVESEWNIDPDRRYLFGMSLGADVALEDLYESHDVWAGVLVAEGFISNREGLLSGNDPAGSWTSAQAAAQVAALAVNVPIRHFQSTSDTNNTAANAEETAAAFSAAGSTAYSYLEDDPLVAGKTHVAAYTAVVDSDAQWAWLLSQVKRTASPAVRSWVALAPAVALSITASPAHAARSWTALSPSVALSVTASPSPAQRDWTALAPSVTLGGVTAAPSPAVRSRATLSASVSLGGITASPSHAASAWASVGPSVSGALTASPSHASRSWVALSPSAGGNTTANPNAATLSWVVPAPAVSRGGVTVSPSPAARTRASASPSIAMGSVTATPLPAVSARVTAGPSTTLGGVTASPLGSSSSWVALQPGVSGGGLAGAQSSVSGWVVPAVIVALGPVVAVPTPSSPAWVALSPSFGGGVPVPEAQPSAVSSSWRVPAAMFASPLNFSSEDIMQQVAEAIVGVLDRDQDVVEITGRPSINCVPYEDTTFNLLPIYDYFIVDGVQTGGLGDTRRVVVDIRASAESGLICNNMLRLAEEKLIAPRFAALGLDACQLDAKRRDVDVDPDEEQGVKTKLLELTLLVTI